MLIRSVIHCFVLSFGITMWELFSEEKPFQGCPMKQIMRDTRRGKTLEIDSSWPSNIANLMRCCWKFEPEQRISMPDIHFSLGKSHSGSHNFIWSFCFAKFKNNLQVQSLSLPLCCRCRDNYGMKRRNTSSMKHIFGKMTRINKNLLLIFDHYLESE